MKRLALAGLSAHLILASSASAGSALPLAPAQSEAPASHSVTVTLSCLVSARGALTDCNVVGERPADANLVSQALEMSKRFRIRPMTRDGKPSEGMRVEVPLSIPGSGEGVRPLGTTLVVPPAGQPG